MDLWRAFDDTPCEATSCGFKQVTGGCAPTVAPKKVPTPLPGSESLGSDGAKARSVASWLLVACLGVAF